MAWNKEKAIEYAKEAKAAVFATVNTEDNTPQLRYVGGYGMDGSTFYLNTGKDSAKVKQIKSDGNVAILFQHEGQESLKNVTFYGKATILQEKEAEKGREIIKARRPQAVFDDTKVIIRVDVEKIKILDFADTPKIQELSI